MPTASSGSNGASNSPRRSSAPVRDLIPFRTYSNFALPVALWILAAWIAGTSVYALVAFRHPLPYSDQWGLVVPFATIGRDGLGAFLEALWRPHLEHRLALVRLANAIDHDLFGFRNHANATLLFAAMAGQVLLLAGALRRSGADPDRVYAMALPVALGCVFAGAQSQNLTWSMGLQWHATNFFVVACVYFVVRSAGAPTDLRGLASTLAGLCCAAAATLSSAGGLMAWPILALLALRFALPYAAACYAAAGSAVWFAYFVDMPARAGGARLLDPFVALPLEAAGFVMRFLGQPWYFGPVGADLDGAALAAGAAALLASVGILLLALRAPAALARPAAVAAAAMLFVAGTAAGAASGRVAEFGALQGLTPRYGSAAVLFWAAALAFAVSLRSHARAGAIAAVATLLWFAGYQPRMLERVEGWYLERELAALTVLAGVADDQRLLPIYPSTRRVLDYAEELRAAGKSVFGEPRAAWLGRPVASFPVAPGACAIEAGPLLEVRTTGDGTLVNQRLSGSAIDAATKKPVRDIAIARAADGVIVGLGRGGFPGERWEAVIRPSEGLLHVYAVVGPVERPALCPL